MPTAAMTDLAETLKFRTDNQSMWSSGSAIRIDDKWTLFSESFSDSFSLFDNDLTAQANASAALVLDVKGDSGGVSLDYPLNVTFTTPNQIAPGQQFTVQTSAVGLAVGTPHFSAVFPSIDIDLKAILNFNASATIDSFWIPGSPYTFGASYNDTKTLLHVHSGDTKTLLPGFTVTMPTAYDPTQNQESTASGSVANNVTLDVTTPNFANLNVDLLEALKFIVGPEFPSLSGSLLDGDITYDILQANLDIGIAITQQFQFVPVAINVALTAPWGVSQTVALGQSASFQVPVGWTGKGDLAASYSITGNLVSQTGFVGNATLDLQALAGGLDHFGSFGPLYQNTFPLYTSSPLYIYNPSGSGGFNLQGFNSPSHSVAIALGTGDLDLPGGTKASALGFSANNVALLQSTLQGLGGSATNLYDPANGSGNATASPSMLDVALVTTAGRSTTLNSGFEAGLLEASGSLTGTFSSRLLAAAPGAGGTATLTAGANELMVAGQGGNVTFNINPTFSGSIAGLDAGDSIVVSNLQVFSVFLQGSTLAFSDGFFTPYSVQVSGDLANLNFSLTNQGGSAVVAITSKDANVVGSTTVALQGSQASTWSQETNLGDLATDGFAGAFLGFGSFARAEAGDTVSAAASSVPVVGLMTAATLRSGIDGSGNPQTGKPVGGISQLDVEHALPGNQPLMVFDTTAAGLKSILEHAVAAGSGQSRFAQVSGLRYSFDTDDRVGSRVKNVALVNDAGLVTARVIENGVVSSSAPNKISVVTTADVANGGDGYTLKGLGSNFRYLLAAGGTSAAIDEALDFTAATTIPSGVLGEQKALIDQLSDHFGSAATVFSIPETGPDQDMRVQDLNSRTDKVFQGESLTAGGSGGTVTGSAGDDTINGDSGDDILTGGPGADQLNLGTGNDILRDSRANMNGDRIAGFGINDSIEVTSGVFGRADLFVDHQPGKTVFSVGGSTFELASEFPGGDFMSVTRGTGADAKTTTTYVPYLPNLQEGVRVDPASINGVANAAFMTGDGAVRFTLDMKSANSAFHNALGTYTVAADGTIKDTHVLFADTLQSAGRSVDLGTPGLNEKIGFFLVQDAVGHFGRLSDDLSFANTGGGAAHLGDATAPLLVSASLGTLGGAPVFHSFANLNPGSAPQVLSGVAPGGRELQVGFEDMQSGLGDNDYQDVVFNVRVSNDHIL